MIEIRIPKEINTYEAKFIGPFTMRQCICLLFALPTCVFLYNFLTPYISKDVVVFVLLFPAGIAYLFGWFKPYGMKFEKFLQSVFISSFVAPQKRLYKTENFYSLIAEEIQKEEALIYNADKKKQSKKQYRRSKYAIK